MLTIIFIIACFIIIGIVAGIKTPNNNLGSNNGAQASNTNSQIQQQISTTVPINIKVTAELTTNPKYTDAICKAMNVHNEYMSSSLNPKWHRTEIEKNVFHSFHLKYNDVVKSYETRLHDNRNKAWDSNILVDEQIQACKLAIAVLKDFKQFCYANGGKIYFQDMWEHCHNSKEECFSFESKLKERLEYLQNNRDDLIYVQTHKSTLRSELKEYLSSHEGVVQKDIYKDFNPLLKSAIQHELYLMDKEGVIKRGKKGSSYLVELIN